MCEYHISSTWPAGAISCVGRNRVGNVAAQSLGRRPMELYSAPKLGSSPGCLYDQGKLLGLFHFRFSSLKMEVIKYLARKHVVKMKCINLYLVFGPMPRLLSDCQQLVIHWLEYYNIPMHITQKSIHPGAFLSQAHYQPHQNESFK